MGDSHGRFVWYELMTTDLEAANAFYGEVVGWRTVRPQCPVHAIRRLRLVMSLPPD